MTSIFRGSACFGMALLWIVVFQQSSRAEQAPLTWPDGWAVSEEADIGGDVTWRANLIADEEMVVASIQLTKMGMNADVQKDIEHSYAVMQEVAVQTARAGNQTMICTRGVKKEIASLSAVQGNCTLSGDEGEQRQVLTLLLGKDSVFSLTFTAMASEYDKYLPVWETVQKSARFK